MRKRIAPLLFLAIFCLVLLQPLYAHGATGLDPHAQASLTLCYQKDTQTFPDLPVSIYRVAEALPDGTFELIEPFASYPVNIHGITTQEQWQQVAQTLYAYSVANQVQPDRQARTDETGTACFTGLQTGLYLVDETVAEHSDGTYLFNRFMVYLPTPQPDGSYDYDVQARPKCTAFIPKSQYTVTKLWQDAGQHHHRPKEVTVDIYQDGILVETQLLSAANNWTYTWYVSDADHGKWTVTERAVPDEYKVTILQNGSHFSIINARPAPPDPPKTGDTFAPMPLIMVMCVAGMLLLLLGLYGRRHA